MNNKCGCKIVSELQAIGGIPENTPRIEKIVYCPLHANASKLLELVKEALEFGNEPEGWNKRIDSVIAKVEKV